MSVLRKEIKENWRELLLREDNFAALLLANILMYTGMAAGVDHSALFDLSAWVAGYASLGLGFSISCVAIIAGVVRDEFMYLLSTNIPENSGNGKTSLQALLLVFSWCSTIHLVLLLLALSVLVYASISSSWDVLWQNYTDRNALILLVWVCVFAVHQLWSEVKALHGFVGIYSKYIINEKRKSNTAKEASQAEELN